MNLEKQIKVAKFHGFFSGLFLTGGAAVLIYNLLNNFSFFGFVMGLIMVGFSFWFINEKKV